MAAANRSKRVHGLLFAVVPFLLFGCGGSGSGGTAGGGIGGSGITVSAVSVGSVASFGSIIVNDVEFDTTNAEVVVEGEAVFLNIITHPITDHINMLMIMFFAIEHPCRV